MKIVEFIPKENSAPVFESAIMSPAVASIAPTDNPGIIMVKYSKNSSKPARLLSHINRQDLMKKESVGKQVMIVFENGNPDLPVIIGVMENVLEDLVCMEVTTNSDENSFETNVDGKRIQIEAESEIVLKCGKGSITIKKEGKIVVRGTEIISRASGTNKIKGSNIKLN